MTVRSKALMWAMAIILAALASVMLGLSDGAAFGITAGLSGAAWGSLSNDMSCARGCIR